MIIAIVIAASVPLGGWLGSDFVEAKKDQFIYWADSTYVRQDAYVAAQNRQEKRRIKQKIFEIKRIKEERPLTDVEQEHLEDLMDDLHNLQ